MTNITITVNAPELVQALISLANAMEGKTGSTQGTAPQSQPQTARQQSYQQQPAQPVNQMPQTPTQPPYQQPAQQQYGVPTQVYTAPDPQSVYQQQIPMPSAPQPTVPTAAQTYTMEQLSVAGTQLVDAGRMPELQQLLAGFGVSSMMQLPKEQYGAFATQLRAMGAKI